MMTRKYILWTVWCLCVCFACSEQDIRSFEADNQLYFEKFYANEQYPGTAQADSTMASFFFYPDGTQHMEVPLTVLFSGVLPEEDISFRLRVVEAATTALPEEYTLDPYYVFHANSIDPETRDIRDVIHIKLHRSARLENMPEGVRLVVEIVPDEQVKWGQLERVRANINLSTVAVKPLWWNNEVTDNLLGRYSQKKYRLFLNHADTLAEMSEDLIRTQPDRAIQLTLLFKTWLNEQYPRILDEDGSLMEVKL